MNKIYLIVIIVGWHYFHNNSLYAQSSWTARAGFPGATRLGASGFSIGTKGYVGTGRDTTWTFYNDFWEWDQQTNTWTQKANYPGGGQWIASSFSIATKGYIGMGDSSVSNIVTDFWEWDQATNTWTQKNSYHVLRESAVGFSIGTKGYVGTGDGVGNFFPDFWEYNPATDTWTQKANFGGGDRTLAVGFSIGNKGYIGTGCDNNNYPWGDQDFWEYDPVTNVWTRKADFPGIGRSEGSGFNIGQYGYIGVGTSKIGSGDTTDFWRYDPTINSWSQVANYAGGLVEMAVSFSIGCYGYIVTGFTNDSTPYNSGLWQFYDSTNTTCVNTCVLTSSFQCSDSDFCGEPGRCIDFTDLSICNPTSWQWSFPGAVLSSSTLQNPAGICYYTPGTFPVTLIVSNSSGTDTLTIAPMIIVGGTPPLPTISIIGTDTLISSHAVAYQWFLNGSAIGGATDSFYVAQQWGTYAVMITDSNGCTRLSNGMPLAVDEISHQGEIILYPNPASEKITFNGLKFTDHARLEIFNLLGEKVYSVFPLSLNGTAGEADISSLSNGIYWFEISDKQNIYRGQVIKK